MTSNSKKSVLPSCPICIETLTPPVRMLPCGHNLCHGCLEGLCNSQNNSCPTCREEFELGRQGVHGIPRNREVENLIDHFNNMRVTAEAVSQPQVLLAGDALTQLTDLASSYMCEKKFDEAISILDTIILQVKGWNKVRPTVDKVKCILELCKIDDAVHLIQSTISMIDSSEFLQEQENTFEDFYDLILELSELCPLDYYETTIALLHRLFGIVQCMDCKESVKKLRSIETAMIRIASHLSKNNKCSEIKKQYPLMEAVLEEFYKLNDADMKVKAENVAWFLDKFGYICDEAKDYYKAISSYEKAIAIMKTVFSKEATKHMVLGVCYHNMGCAIEHTNKFIEAKSAFTSAIEAYNECTDRDEEVKTSNIFLSVEMLEVVEEKLSNG